MFCIQCGNYNPDNSAFCGKCGAKLAKEASSPSFMPVEGVPPGGGASSPAGEYIPIVQEMPPASSYPMSQGTQPTPQVAQSGYGMPQNYPPQTYPANDQNRSAEMFGFTQPAFTGQTPSGIDNYQNVWQ